MPLGLELTATGRTLCRIHGELPSPDQAAANVQHSIRVRATT